MLLQQLMIRCSRFAPAQFLRESATLIGELLLSQANDGSAGARKLRARVAAHGYVRCPEYYFCLARLRDAESLESNVLCAAIEGVLDAPRVASPYQEFQRWWRLAGRPSHRSLWCASAEGEEPVTTATQVSECGVWVVSGPVRAWSGLTGWSLGDTAREGAVPAVVREALVALGRFDAALLADLSSVVSQICVTPIPVPGRWSFSARLPYFGGIFLDVSKVPRAGVVEALLHEYLHQRLWQWWAFEPLEGACDETQELRSPVTGNLRSVPVLLQALAIYTEVRRWLAAAPGQRNEMHDPFETSWQAQRLELLDRALPVLAERLHCVLPANSMAVEFVSACQEYHAASL